jgi:NADH:ubiquinone oxidoreductase subunit 5 (subunit L)/multisubunit Na+/H+ antiporter MnhA subunit
LSGFPFLSAFFSKDKIIEESLRIGGNVLWIFLLIISIIFTTFYSFRLIFYTRVEKSLFPLEENKDRVSMTKRIIVLTFGGITGGRLLSWIIFDSFYDNIFFYSKFLILFFVFRGLILGYTIKLNYIRIFSFYMTGMWFLVNLRTSFISSLGINYGKYVLKRWDCGWNEILGPQGLKNEIFVLSYKIDKINHLNYKIILMITFISTISLIIYFFIYCCSL